MAKAPKYPNPTFFRAKDNMNLRAQVENIKEIGGIVGGMIKETDFKAFGKNQLRKLKNDGERVVREVKAIAAMSGREKMDLLMNGEKHLGNLYRSGDMATVRREWRGVKDTAYDFFAWGRVWAMLLMTFSKDLIPALNTLLYYRWFVSYFCCVGFLDKCLMGMRGSNLRMSHLSMYTVFRYVAENLVFLAKADAKNGNSAELN